MSSPPVLIVGAGPTGLVLALRLRRHGLTPRIIDKASGPGQASRATVVHARTLEFYQQLGLADELVGRGIPLRAMCLREQGRTIATIPLGAIGEGLSPFPFVLSFPQDDHERFLTEQLHGLGVEIEWNTELVGFTQDDSGVTATLAQGPTQSRARVAYLCGCDGAHSRVRTQLALSFAGGTYEQRFFVADVMLTTPLDSDFHITIGAKGFALMMPVRSSGSQRLVGTLPAALAERDDLSFADVQAGTEQLMGITVTAVNWFSAYRVHHRVAGHFHIDRVFLLGDAGHVHSPAGGQGMNTGIGDAVNLGWKLAAVLQGRAHSRLLDTYEHERIAFARSLVKTTDSIFTAMVNTGIRGHLLRRWVMPHVMPWLTHFQTMQRLIFRTVSQVRIAYRDSALSEGLCGTVGGGDRLPWVPGTTSGAGNFASLQSLSWRVHVYGKAAPEAVDLISQLRLPLDVYPWDELARTAGLARDACYLIRPDGYVGIALAPRDIHRLRSYLRDWSIIIP